LIQVLLDYLAAKARALFETMGANHGQYRMMARGGRTLCGEQIVRCSLEEFLYCHFLE